MMMLILGFAKSRSKVKIVSPPGSRVCREEQLSFDGRLFETIQMFQDQNSQKSPKSQLEKIDFSHEFGSRAACVGKSPSSGHFMMRS